MTETKNEENKLGLLNLIVIILSIYVLGALIIDSFFVLPQEISNLLNYVDNLICLFLFF